jgi:alpha-galactosidase
MVTSGMKDAGYEYVVIDDCWHGQRDANGFITADPQKFPSGIKALSDYVHSKGLKFGIYSDAGKMTCGKRPGSQGYEYQDALTYARWGVDYLKYDWCYTGTRNAEEAYALMADALKASGRDIVGSVSCTVGIMLVVVFAKQLSVSVPWLAPVGSLAWPWYVPLGTTLAVGIGMLLSYLPHRTHGPQ